MEHVTSRQKQNHDVVCHVPSAVLITGTHVELESPEPGSLSD